MEKQTKFCQYCGAEIDHRAEICPKCGIRQPSLTAKMSFKKKNPILAAVLSFIINGSGQIYVGQIGRGIGILIFSLIIMGILAFSVERTVYWIIAVGIWSLSAYDAYSLAEKYNAYIENHQKPPW